MKKPVHRAMYLEDVLLALYDAERTYADLERSDVLEPLSIKQKVAYRDTLNRMRVLIHQA